MTTRPSLHQSSTFSAERVAAEAKAREDASMEETKTAIDASPEGDSGPEATDKAEATWMADPTWDPETQWFHFFSRKTIPGDGDCLFSSVADILRHMPPLHLATVQANLVKAGITRITVEDLKEADMVRSLSVANIFRQTPAMKSIIKDWRFLYAMAKKEKNMSLANDLRHMACIEHVTDEELNDTHLKLLYNSMRQKSTYWGTEFDMIHLESLLGVRFIVISHEGKVQTIASDHPDTWRPSMFCLLYRRQIHAYDPPHFQVLHWNENERRAFFPGELPPMIVSMCKRALPATTSKRLPWYVTMDFSKVPPGP